MPAKQKEENDSAFKHWISVDLVKRISAHIQHNHSSFDSKKFEAIGKQLAVLEMKPRVRAIRDQLKVCLPEDYSVALKIIMKAVKNPAPRVSSLEGFSLWPFSEFIQTYGTDSFEDSMKALHELTQIFTAEFAIRPFIIKDEKKALKILNKWATDSNVHVRRLVSEGSRPRLPWGEQLKSFIKDPSPTLELLEKLKYDDELYVRKSVANHLNDISKDHPKVALATAKRWRNEAPKEHKTKIEWITRHALRTLLKKGNPEALKILGFESKGMIQLKNFKLHQESLRIGQYLEFSFELTGSVQAQVMVDYLIHHKKSNGGTTAKVFKLTTKTLKAKEKLQIKKKHSFKVVTTRVYYPGTHHLEIMVNGKLLKKVPFELKK